MGGIAHNDIGTELTKTEFEDASLHLIGGVADLNIVRSATYIVAASGALAASRAECDGVGDGTADDVQILAGINALPS